jgi:hypothetical protein
VLRERLKKEAGFDGDKQIKSSFPGKKFGMGSKKGMGAKQVRRSVYRSRYGQEWTE